MKRTILMSLLVVGAVVALIVGASFALFDDKETASGNLAQAGTIDLEVNGHNDAVPPVTVSDLKPSWWVYRPFLLHNAGTNPGIPDLHIAGVLPGQGGTLTDAECEAEGGIWAGDTCTGTGWVPINDIEKHIEVDWCLDLNGNGACDLGEPGDYLRNAAGDPGKLNELVSQTVDLPIVMNPSDVVALLLSFHLQSVEPGATDNVYQGDVVSFDVDFTLHQLSMAGATTVGLENKTGDWQPIRDDDLYGGVTYWVTGGDLAIQVWGNGLTADKWHQITLNGPGGCTATDDQLASGVQLYPDFDSGFWDGAVPLKQGACPAGAQGIYNFAYVLTDASGNFTDTVVIHNAGVADPAGGAKVSGPYPSLPSGTYSGVKFIVKEIGGVSPPDTSWTPKIMEMDVLNFTLP